MDADEMRHHLSGADSTTGRGGPAGGEGALAQALSVVSTDVGELRARVQALGQDVDKVEGLQTKLAQVAEKVAELHDVVKELAAREEAEPPPPPPQPWDWASMNWEDELAAVATLATWVETRLALWWPRTALEGEGLPGCWMHHPDMLRDLSLLYVSYQQAYEHPQRRVHHEVDYRRTLEDMLRDIHTAAQKYHCGDDAKHILQHEGRSDRTRAAQHVRSVAAAAAFDADQAGDTTRVTEIVEKFALRPEDLRGQATRAWPGAVAAVTDATGSRSERVRAAGTAAHLLDAYRVVDPTDLREAAGIEQVLHLLHQVQDDRFPALRERYGDLVQRFATIRQEMNDLRPLTPRGQALMERHGITEHDVAVVLNMLAR